MKPDRQKYTDECKTIQQNATYTAETHHQIANRYWWIGTCFQVIPAALAAITGGLVAQNVFPDWTLWLSVMSATVATVANVINPMNVYQSHLGAAKSFTVIKHEARGLHSTFSSGMEDEAYAVAVKNLHDRYNDLVRIAPSTTGWAFKKAQDIIKGGAHEPDKDKDGNIL